MKPDNEKHSFVIHIPIVLWNKLLEIAGKEKRSRNNTINLLLERATEEYDKKGEKNDGI